MATTVDGDFVVVWASELFIPLAARSADGWRGSDGSGSSIQGQRFSVPLFADGFESGDTSAWSTTVP